MTRAMWSAAALAACLSLSGSAMAVTVFTATLTGDQEVPPRDTMASGTATFTLNDAMDRLEYEIQILGLDLGGQTPDTLDDVIGMHIHRAPAGVNGTVVFGMIGPGHDANDIMIDAVAGTVSGAWDLTDPANSSLTDELDELFMEGLYLNVHTNRFTGGEIRGQIVPEPGSILLLLGGALGLWRRRR